MAVGIPATLSRVTADWRQKKVAEGETVPQKNEKQRWASTLQRVEPPPRANRAKPSKGSLETEPWTTGGAPGFGFDFASTLFLQCQRPSDLCTRETTPQKLPGLRLAPICSSTNRDSFRSLPDRNHQHVSGRSVSAARCPFRGRLQVPPARQGCG